MARHILAYHAVTDAWEFSAASVSRRVFTEHCTALAARGWQATRLDGVGFADGTADEVGADRSFALTVDDGYESLATIIVPECARHGWQGTAFIPAALVGGDGSWDVGAARTHRHADWPALADVVAAGWEIGVHGAAHRALTDMAPQAAYEELCGARDTIEQHLGVTATSLAYPFGAVSRRVVEAARRAGYLRAVTMRPGPVPARPDMWRLPRWPVYRIDRPEHLFVRLGGPRWAQLLEQAKTWTIQQFARGTRVRMAGTRHVERTT